MNRQETIPSSLLQEIEPLLKVIKLTFIRLTFINFSFNKGYLHTVLQYFSFGPTDNIFNILIYEWPAFTTLALAWFEYNLIFFF